MDDLNAFQRDLLYVVANRDRPHGLRIKADVETYYPDDVNNGQLYPNLDEVVERGLVEKGTIDDRTNYYDLRPAGERALLERRRWEDEQLRAGDSVPVDGSADG